MSEFLFLEHCKTDGERLTYRGEYNPVTETARIRRANSSVWSPKFRGAEVSSVRHRESHGESRYDIELENWRIDDLGICELAHLHEAICLAVNHAWPNSICKTEIVEVKR